MEDITKTGPVGLKGLQGINRQNESDTKWDDLLSHIKQTSARALSEEYTPQQSTDVGVYALQAGYGESTYDDAIQRASQLENIQDIRAIEQPWYAKIGAGTAKMGVLAATTFADSILGTVAGIFNVASEAINGNIQKASDAWWKFIDNPLSGGLQQVNEASERWLPNYYTQYEQQAPWYENIFTANFIGDKFLKNLGFTIGAAAGAYVTGRLGAKTFIKKGIRDAFKGTVVNSAGKALTTGSDIYKAYKAGDAIMDGIKLTEDLAKSAKQLKNAEQRIKLLGAVAGAMGEGRIEAISGVKEWSEAQETYAENAHKDYQENLKAQMYEENPEYFEYMVDAEGNYIPVLTEEGQRVYNKRLTDEQSNFENLMADINKDKAAIGNSIFGLNVALLTMSDLYQWGRFISGGYTSGRIAKGLVSGNLKDGYKIAKNAIRKKQLRALSNPLMEAQEEMSQSSIQEGSGMWKSRELNSKFGEFYGGKIDPDAEEDTDSWLGNIMNGFATTYSSFDKWEEGFIGGLTGLLGIPTIKTKANGKKEIALQGELLEGLSEAKKMKEEANTIVEALNKNIKSPEFLNYYQGKIRHDAAQNEMDTALERGDRFDFLNSEHKQMVSDAIMYDKAGRIEDLYDLIDQAANTTLEDVSTLRQQAVDQNTGKSIFEGKTDQQVVEHVKKQAQTMKDTVDKYVQISNDLKTLYGDKVSSDVLEELTWGMTQVDNWEGRLKDLASTIKTPLQEKAKELKERFGIDIDITLDNLTDFANSFNEDKNLINEINEIVEDKSLSIQEQRDKIDNLIKEKELTRRNNNLELGRKITQIRRDFKNSRERLEKQRVHLLKQIDKADADKKEFLKNSEEYKQQFEDNKNAQIQLIKDTREKIEKIRKSIFGTNYKNTKTSKRLSKRQQALKETEEELGRLIEELDSMEANNEVNEARLNDIMSLLDTRILAIEGLFVSNTIIDRRTKLEYIPGQSMSVVKTDKNGNPIRDEHGNSVYEDRLALEEETRRQYQAENESLFSQIVALKEMLNDKDNQIINALDTNKLNEALSDMIKIHSARAQFLDMYQGLSEHPELYQDALQEKIKQALQVYKDKEADKVQSSLEKATTVKDIKKVLDEEGDDEVVQTAIDRINTGDNKELKSLIKNYNNIKEAEKIIFGEEFSNTDDEVIGGILGSMTTGPEVADAGNIIKDILDNAVSAQDANDKIAEKIEKLKENPSTELVAGTIKSIMDKYAELSKSRNTNKSDKKASKKIKGKGKLSFDDLDEENNTEDSIVDTDEDNKDKEDTTEKPARRNPDKSLPKFDDGGLESLDDDDFNLDLSDDIEDTEEDKTDDSGPSNEGASEDIDLLQTLNEMDIDELQDFIDDIDNVIANGLTINGNAITAEEKDTVIKLATKILDRKKYPKIHSSKDDTGTNSESALPSSSDPYYRSWISTEYLIDDAKRKKQAVQSTDIKAIALKELGVFDFVNKGKLGILLADNPDLKIHFITTSKGPLKDDVILAIKIDNDVENLGIEGSSIVDKNTGDRYQAVGALGWNSKNRTATTNCKTLKEAIFDERNYILNTTGNDQTFVVSQKFTNTISHIYSGRMITSTEFAEKKQRGLKEVLAGETPIFGVYFSDTSFKTDASIDAVPLNSNNSNPREGSLWLMTQEADGRYYGKALKIKRFTKDEYNINEHIDTPVMQEILEAISIIVDPELSDTERALAKLQLEDYLYFPGESKISFSEDIVWIKDKDGNVIEYNIGEGLTEEDKIMAVLEVLQRDELNLRFQVDSYKVAEHPSEYTNYINQLLDSDIITTDLAVGFIHNVNASFDMPLLDPKTGKVITNPATEDRVGHTRSTGINNTIAQETVIVNGNEYGIDNNGNITLEGSNVKDENTIEEVKLQQQIKHGEIQPVEGSTNLYIGVYPNMEEFGIINGKVKTGDALEELKEKAEVRVRKQAEKEVRNGAPTLDTLAEDDDESSDSSPFDWLEGDITEKSLFEEDNDAEPSIEDLLPNLDEDDDNPNLDWLEGDIPERELFKEDSEESKPKKQTTVPSELAGETFNPDYVRQIDENQSNPNSLLIANMNKLVSNGKKIGFKKWKELAEEAGIDFNTLTSQEKFDAAISTVNCYHK